VHSLPSGIAQIVHCFEGGQGLRVEFGSSQLRLGKIRRFLLRIHKQVLGVGQAHVRLQRRVDGLQQGVVGQKREEVV